MALRRRLVPVAALVVAIGASAAGAATAAATGGSGNGGTAGGTDKGKAVASCEIKIQGGDAGPDAIKAKLGDAARLGDTVKNGVNVKGGGKQPGGDPCQKPVQTVGLDKIAAELGVSPDALLKALDATKQWLGTSGVNPKPDLFNQHVAGLLHLPVDKVAAVLGSGPRIGVKTGP